MSCYSPAMAIKRVNPAEAAELMAQGWTYVDVRTIPEFDAGHPSGAFNVPLLHQGDAGRTPNPDFMAVMSASFDKAQKLVLGCRSGKRSLRAAAQLVDAGYEHVVDMEGGYLGDGSCEGWQPRGLAIDQTAVAGRTYAELQKAK